MLYSTNGFSAAPIEFYRPIALRLACALCVLLSAHSASTQATPVTFANTGAIALGEALISGASAPDVIDQYFLEHPFDGPLPVAGDASVVTTSSTSAAFSAASQTTLTLNTDTLANANELAAASSFASFDATFTAITDTFRFLLDVDHQVFGNGVDTITDIAFVIADDQGVAALSVTRTFAGDSSSLEFYDDVFGLTPGSLASISGFVSTSSQSELNLGVSTITNVDFSLEAVQAAPVASSLWLLGLGGLGLVVLRKGKRR